MLEKSKTANHKSQMVIRFHWPTF